jgi:ABC-type nitrate/sulfonate/bicarbonate transport system permease component
MNMPPRRRDHRDSRKSVEPPDFLTSSAPPRYESSVTGWRRFLGQQGPPILFLLLLLLLWQGLNWLGGAELWLLPSPWQIVTEGVDSWLHLGLPQHTLQTLAEAGLGFLLAVATALVLALVVDFSPLLRRTVYPLLVVSQTIPIIAIAPILVLWLGYGIMPKVLVVALVCFFPIVISTADGLRSTDPEWTALLRSMGANRWQIFSKVRFPNALPAFFSGLKVAITYSVIGAVIGEWVGGNLGLAIFMRLAHNSMRFGREFAGIAIVSLLSIVLFLVVAGLERLALPWYYARRPD